MEFLHWYIDQRRYKNEMADVLDILELGRPGTPEVTKESIMGTQKTKPKYKPKNEVLRKPEGMARELFNLLVNDSKDSAPLFPTDTGNVCYHIFKVNYITLYYFLNVFMQVKDTNKQKLN